jgi:hypothetical protein
MKSLYEQPMLCPLEPNYLCPLSLRKIRNRVEDEAEAAAMEFLGVFRRCDYIRTGGSLMGRQCLHKVKIIISGIYGGRDRTVSIPCADQKTPQANLWGVFIFSQQCGVC